MMNFSIFGSIFQIFIVYAIIKVIYKALVQGKSETLDSTITKFVDQVKSEINGKPTTRSTKSSSTKVEQPKITDDYQFTTSAEGSYSNADDLLKSGLITKEEYRKIKK